MKKVLIADDDKEMRALLGDILRSDKYELLFAEDGQQALELIYQTNIDLLITDRSMPRLDGLQLLRRLKEEKREIPTIVISAYGEEKLWAEAIGLGAQDYLLKPFKNDDVLKLVQRHLKPPKKGKEGKA